MTNNVSNKTVTATATATPELGDATIARLRELRQLCVDSAKGYDECAELTKLPELRATFTKLAAERADQAAALGAHIASQETVEPEEGSYLAGLHRAWLKVRDAFSTDSLATVLAEARRGEEAIKNAYQRAAEETAGSPIHAMIQEQCDRAVTWHTVLRDFEAAYNS